MSYYSELSFYTRSTDCGTDSRLAPHVLMADLQETADIGAKDTGWGRDEIGLYNCCWIILRCRLKIEKLPSWRENFTIRTWSCGAKKLFFDREYEVYDEDSNVICRATSVWILADKDTHNPVFPSKLTSLPSDFARSDKLSLGKMCPKLKCPDKEFFEDKSLIVKYADYTELDHNHHVNNTRYIAWIFDALRKGGFDVHKVNDININYLSEVKEGQRVDIYAKNDGGELAVAGFEEGGKAVFTAQIKFCF